MLPACDGFQTIFPFSPVTLICPRCGAQPGAPCAILKNQVEVIHTERIEAASEKIQPRGRSERENRSYKKQDLRPGFFQGDAVGKGSYGHHWMYLCLQIAVFSVR